MSLFAFDFDGTLLPSFSSGLPDPEKRAIFSLLEKGHAVCFASGRPLSGCKHIIPFIHPNIYFLTINGAACFSSEGDLLFERPMELKDALSLIKKYGQGNILPYSYGSHDEIYAYSKHRFIELEMDVNHVPEHCYRDISKLGETGILKTMFAGEPEDIDAIAVDPLDLKRFSVARSNPMFLEFNALGVSKGTSLGLLAEKLGISKDDIYAFGDADNDAEMIGMYHGVAMDNASPKCKENAEIITGACVDHGVVTALKKLGFID